MPPIVKGGGDGVLGFLAMGGGRKITAHGPGLLLRRPRGAIPAPEIQPEGARVHIRPVESKPRRPRRGGIRPIIGWREWVALPDLGVDAIKVKVDTGARTSALHAFDLEVVRGPDGGHVARFEVHPLQRSARQSLRVEAPVLEFRAVRNSGGQREERPVILTTIGLLDRSWPIELTLTRRDEMGFRMLLGREAVRRHFYVDPGRSFYGGRKQVSLAGDPPPPARGKRRGED